MMGTTALPPVRRIVTGYDAEGRSIIECDGPSDAILTIAERPGYANANLWRTVGAGSDVAAADSIGEHSGVLPPRHGTVLRVIDIPPEPTDPEERRRQTERVFATMFADARHDRGHSQPGMHTTDTIDYAILLSGELVAVMEAGETVMRAGDVLIQRGTAHAWRNRTQEIARIAFILVDGSRV